jgi:hypothetical protein
MTWTPFHFLVVAVSDWMCRGQQVACRQINAATVVKALSPIGDTPADEAQARPLTRTRDKDGTPLPGSPPPPVRPNPQGFFTKPLRSTLRIESRTDP